jgi:hypothetical protein
MDRNCIPRFGANARTEGETTILSVMRSSWHRYFFYRKKSWKTTWTFRLGVVLIAAILFLTTRSFLALRIGESLACKEQLPKSDALLLENFDPDYLVFERARQLEHDGIAARAFVPTNADEEGGPPNAVAGGTVELMARIARLDNFEILPIRIEEPISLHAAAQIRDVLVRDHINSVIVVTPGFRSRRSALVYSAVLSKAGIRVACAPVWGVTTPENWTQTWHGIQNVVEHFGKLQYYRFWVLR